MPSAWETLPATFTSRTALEHGVHQRDLYRRRDAGDVVELSRGVFRRTDAPAPTHPDLLAIAYRAPKAIVCCVSAAVVHELADESPDAVQIAMPKRDRPPKIDEPATEVFRFDANTFEVGLTSVDAAEGEPVRIYDPVRTVVDLMRLRDQLGEPLAHTAVQRYVRRPDAQPGRVLRLADTLKVYGPMRDAMDAASAD